MGTKYELVRRPSMISLVIPSSVNLKCRPGSRNGELITGFSITALLNDLWVEDFSEFYLGKTARGPRGPNYPPVALI
jgi:hypothetical protein